MNEGGEVFAGQAYSSIEPGLLRKKKLPGSREDLVEHGGKEKPNLQSPPRGHPQPSRGLKGIDETPGKGSYHRSQAARMPNKV